MAMVFRKVGVLLFSVQIRNNKNEAKKMVMVTCLKVVQLNSPGVFRGEALEESFVVAI